MSGLGKGSRVALAAALACAWPAVAVRADGTVARVFASHANPIEAIERLPRAASQPPCSDAAPPSVPTFTTASLPVGVWVTDAYIAIEWLPATDDFCGIDGYGEYWTSDPLGVPGEQKDLEEIPTRISRTLPDGIWYYSLRAVDAAGHWSVDCARIGPFQIDTVPPADPSGLASTTHRIGVWSRNPRIQLSW